jgi:hypothetical protein
MGVKKKRDVATAGEETVRFSHIGGGWRLALKQRRPPTTT